jgi:mercuric ion transport protein
MSIPEATGAKKMMYVGIAGSIFAALCCSTPVLVLLLSTVGLSAWLGSLDYVLLPALVLFLGIAVWGVWRWRRIVACRATTNKREGLR